MDLESDMQGRLALAQAVLQAGRHDEALNEFVWLWMNIARIDPAMAGVRVSFLAGAIGNLAQVHAPARQRFGALRDQAGAAAAGTDEVAQQARMDWLALNDALGDQERSIRWFDEVKDDPDHAPVLEHAAHWMIPLLRSRKRWPEIGRLYQDPLAHLARIRELVEVPDIADAVPEEMRGELGQMMAQHVREEAALLVLTLRAAGRAEEASAVQTEALRLDGSDEMRLALQATLETG